MRLHRLMPVAALPLLAVTAVPAYAAVSADFANGNYNLRLSAGGDIAVVTCIGGSVSPAPSPAVPCADIESIAADDSPGLQTMDLSAVTQEVFPSLERISLDLAPDGSADVVTGSALPDLIVADFNDIVDGGPGGDRLEGGSEVQGGEGDDIFWEVIGDVADGGPGDDRFINGVPQVGLDGGTGYDTVELDFHQTLLASDFSFTFTAGQLLYEIPGAGAADIFFTGVEQLRMTLLDRGSQEIDLSGFPGTADIRGMAGPDTIIGSNQPDVLHGGSGDDTIDAQDGAFDIVDCGAGIDTASADSIDRISNCENVSYPKPNTGRIKGPRSITKGDSASYTFTSSIPSSVFQCRIDNKKWKTCTSPFRVVANNKLSLGQHTLAVRAGFPAGNWDASPSSKRITVKR